MPPATHSAQDEADFMKELLSGFDNAPTSGSTSCHELSSSGEVDAPALLQPGHELHSSSVVDAPLAAEDIDLEALLEGAEHWVWDNDISSPPKKKPLTTATVQVIPLHSQMMLC
jgi:hypothetical protein